MLHVRTYGDPVLRLRAEPVAEISQAVEQLVREMTETMYADHGVGLAAPQVGTSQRIIVVDTSLGEDRDHPTAMINPQILEAEGEEAMEEGCLSVPDVFETVVRASRVTVGYQDLAGQTRQMACEGLLARIVQHETDHLDGILFVDRISLLKRQLLGGKLKQISQDGPQASGDKGRVLI